MVYGQAVSFFSCALAQAHTEKGKGEAAGQSIVPQFLFRRARSARHARWSLLVVWSRPKVFVPEHLGKKRRSTDPHPTPPIERDAIRRGAQRGEHLILPASV